MHSALLALTRSVSQPCTPASFAASVTLSQDMMFACLILYTFQLSRLSKSK